MITHPEIMKNGFTAVGIVDELNVTAKYNAQRSLMTIIATNFKTILNNS